MESVTAVIEPEMVSIPAGPFNMGTSDQQVAQLAERCRLARTWRDKGHFRREQPQHVITLPEYTLARYPVTVGEYRMFLACAGYQRPQYWTAAGWRWRESTRQERPAFWDDPAWTCDENLPLIGVTWYEAYAYCQWLSDRTGRAYRLPSEAEWEKAARGTDERFYPWGNEFDATRCNTRATALGRTSPVGRFGTLGASFYGCEDMGGNASEWTMSLFRPYPYGRYDGRDDPEAPAGRPGAGGERVIRGGAWGKPALRARTAARGMNDPHFADTDVGFRVAGSGR